MPSVPLISARPSFSASSTGDSPASLSASAAGRRTPWASRTLPSPISASAQCESGARSPEQPSEPYSCTTGVMPALSIPAIVVAVRAGRRCGRSRASRAAAASAPGRPRARPRGRCRRRASGSATAAAGRASGGMCRMASAPNPVETPYDGVAAAASRSTDSRARVIAATASGAISTPSPCRATATTSSNERGPTPTATVMGPFQPRHRPVAIPGQPLLSRIRDPHPDSSAIPTVSRAEGSQTNPEGRAGGRAQPSWLS